MSEKVVILITKDSEENLILQNTVSRLGYTAFSLQNMHEIQPSYTALKPELIVVDLNFSDMDGVQLLNYLVNIQCKAPIIITGYNDERLLLAIKHIAEVKGMKISGILRKPLQENKIEQMLRMIGQQALERIDASKLAKALEENRFEMYYQPKINIRSKKLCGFEALIRWKLQDGNMIPPVQFIPIAEESGLIVPLTHWIIRRVFEDCAEFSINKKGMRFAINLSPKMLNDIVFPDEVSKLARESGAKPEFICFEITESGVSHQSEIILEVLTRLRVLGFSLSIDDFGTGFSSIAELQRLPFNELKVDQSFVFDLVNSQSTQTIVRSTIELGHNLDMQLVAEGVETKEVMQLLEQFQCDISQGYLISKPLSMPDLKSWYTKHIDEDLIWTGYKE